MNLFRQIKLKMRKVEFDAAETNNNKTKISVKTFNLKYTTIRSANLRIIVRINVSEYSIIASKYDYMGILL